jgi:anaerobic glycerol-3-phosphate dehydrogenase
LYSFGQDAGGEPYALFGNGRVLKLVRSLHNPVNAASKDINHDGYADLVWEDTITGQRGIWLLKNGVPAGVINLPTVPVVWSIVDH